MEVAQRFWKSTTHSAQPPGLALDSECPRNPAWSPVEPFILSIFKATVIRFCPLPKNPSTDWKMKPRGGYPETAAKNATQVGLLRDLSLYQKSFFLKWLELLNHTFQNKSGAEDMTQWAKAQARGLQSTGRQRPEELGVQHGEEKMNHPQGKLTSQTSWNSEPWDQWETLPQYIRWRVMEEHTHMYTHTCEHAYNTHAPPHNENNQTYSQVVKASKSILIARERWLHW